MPIPKFSPGNKVVMWLLQPSFTTLLFGYDSLVTKMLLHGCNKLGILYGCVCGESFLHIIILLVCALPIFRVDWLVLFARSGAYIHVCMYMFVCGL